jgi:hypothetical protein
MNEEQLAVLAAPLPSAEDPRVGFAGIGSQMDYEEEFKSTLQAENLDVLGIMGYTGVGRPFSCERVGGYPFFQPGERKY